MTELPPKLAQLRMLDLAWLGLAVTIAGACLFEMAEAGPMRTDRVIAAVGLSAVVWLVLLIADLVMFPRTEMTRFVLTQAAPVAAVTASVHTVFFVLFRGLQFQSILGWFGAFTLHLPVIAIALFIPERRRQQLAKNEHRIP